MCKDRDHHEPCEPEPDRGAEKFSINGRCVKVVRLVGVDKVDYNKKIEHILVKIILYCDSGGKIMVDEDDDIVVDGDRIVVVEVARD
jgi:hypothetical protein